MVSFGGIYHWKEPRGARPDDRAGALSRGVVLQLTSTASNGHPAPILKIYGTAGTIGITATRSPTFYEPRGEASPTHTH